MSKQILIGTDSFEKLIEGDYFYIDKTLLIKELLERRGETTLITRPRRFGKTLNMSMMRSFFDVTRDGSHLFDGLKIMEYKDIVEKHMGKYPVIFMTLKDVEKRTFEGSTENMRDLISALYKKHLYILESDRLDETEKKMFMLFRRGETSDGRLETAVQYLMNCLHAYHGKKVVVLIDEYDAPINNALIEGYYPQMIKFMRGFLGGAFKSNDHLEFGVLTGVNRISKEGLMSGFNNPRVFGIANDEFATCYGFTEEEVKQACEDYGHGYRFPDVKKWYDGYRFGQVQDMYNPWNITHFLKRGVFANYWANTGDVTILENIFFKGPDALKNDMAGLLTDIPVKMDYDEQVTYPIIYKNNSAFWTILFNAGYLKPCVGSTEERFYVEPVNREVKNMFARCIDRWFTVQQPAIHDTILEFVGHLMSGDAEAVKRTLNEDLLNNPSCHDFTTENSYHMFIYGILLAVYRDYVVISNQESGKGRSDCMIKPDDKGKSAVVVEFKHLKELPADSASEQRGLEEEAQKGLEQIMEKAYIHNLKKEGYTNILSYGIAFRKKSCEVAMKGTHPIQ